MQISVRISDDPQVDEDIYEITRGDDQFYFFTESGELIDAESGEILLDGEFKLNWVLSIVRADLV